MNEPESERLVRERIEAMCDLFWHFHDLGDRRTARACLAEARMLILLSYGGTLA